ncbi:signal peptidase II [Prosthecochloris sp. HL-130-GSB]|jgi:signal peptidase II|uniref:signal peptidase II n=1 Tax=Prosthecochloris sp. HL-130-GSB TaxID=1974213 RepID=UPI000A1C1398|nr:signal peptidase II [Prosthecochloris sp. HL-130-GSB]ARM30550.1 signal peptidase II [Prosthecochloris sp. HL-130-GSB]
MIRFFLLAATVIILDRITKLAASTLLREHGSITIIPDWFKFTYIENPGIAFGVDPGSRLLLIGGTVLILLAILIFVLRSSKRNPAFLLSLGLIFGGGTGNLFDRIAYGKVIDFLHLDLYNGYIFNTWVSLWPVFNLADTAITIGAVILLIWHNSIFSDSQ